jgi:hypothetical protein
LLCSSILFLLHHSAGGVCFAGLVEIFDAGLIDHHAGASRTQLYDALVVPLDDAVKLLSVFKDDGHLGLLLHLLLKIEGLGVRTLGRSMAVGNQGVGERIFGVHGVTAALGRRKMGADQLARSVERIVFGACCALALNHVVYLNESRQTNGGKGAEAQSLRGKIPNAGF